MGIGLIRLHRDLLREAAADSPNKGSRQNAYCHSKSLTELSPIRFRHLSPHRERPRILKPFPVRQPRLSREDGWPHACRPLQLSD
jgi:hypothetical protein